jgi:hypothetical protein
MTKLACNVVSYLPDPKLLAAKFRPWHTEALLDQAAFLTERCLGDFKEYSDLDYRWHQFETDLDNAERQLDLDWKCELQYSPLESDNAPAEEVEAEAAPEPEAAEPPEAEEEPPAEGEEGQEPVEEAPLQEPEPEPEDDLPFSRRNLKLRAAGLKRKRELSAPGRPFALVEQRDLALKRLCRDFEEAVDRACVAQEGLKQFYGREELPSPLSNEAETLAQSITNLCNWIRDARDWLDSYKLQEQAFTRSLSVRSFLNRSAWVQLKQARDTFSIKLQIPLDLFKGYENCRIIGVGASLIGEAGKAPWSVMLRLPEEAVYERSGQYVEVDQSGRPQCLLGRVENRRSPHPVEMGGTLSFLNASPICRTLQCGWSVEIYRPTGSSTETFANLEDLVLEIHVVGVPQSSNN